MGCIVKIVFGGAAQDKFAEIYILIYSKFMEMGSMKEIRKTIPHSWGVTLASLLPLWLLSLSIMVEGFPRPPISMEVAIAAFATAIAASSVLLWKKWLTAELLLYSLFPFLLMFIFDEISTAYKTPFIILCTLILTAGLVAYQRSRSSRLLRGFILYIVAILTMFTVSHIADNFWGMASELGYEECFPDGHGCAFLTRQETPWWLLLFSL